MSPWKSYTQESILKHWWGFREGEGKKQAVKGSVAFSHTQSSAQLLAENAGFYQCHSSVNTEESLTEASQLVERRHDDEEQLQSG